MKPTLLRYHLLVEHATFFWISLLSKIWHSSITKPLKLAKMPEARIKGEFAAVPNSKKVISFKIWSVIKWTYLLLHNDSTICSKKPILSHYQYTYSRCGHLKRCMTIATDPHYSNWCNKLSSLCYACLHDFNKITKRSHKMFFIAKLPILVLNSQKR